MATLPVENTFEGGTNGTTITVGNSGGASGDAFSSILGSPIFSNAQAHSGSLAMRIVDAVASTAGVYTGFGSLTGNVFFSVAIRIAALPTGSGATIIHVLDNAGSRVAAFSINTLGQVRVINAAAGAITAANGSVVAPLNQWFRLEARVKPSTTVGEVEWWLYDDVDALTPVDTKVVTGLVLGPNVDGYRTGLTATTPTTPFTIDLDDTRAATHKLGPPFPLITTILDTFTRADTGPPPSSNWATGSLSSGLKVVSNQCATDDAGDNGAYWLSARAADMEGQITIATLPAAGGETACIARFDPATYSGYSVWHVVGTPDTIKLQVIVAGTATDLGSWSQDLANADRIAIRCTGSLIEAYARVSGTWTFIGSATDATYDGSFPNNKAALYSFGSTTVRYDDFIAGPAGPAGGADVPARTLVGVGT